MAGTNRWRTKDSFPTDPTLRIVKDLLVDKVALVLRLPSGAYVGSEGVPHIEVWDREGRTEIYVTDRRFRLLYDLMCLGATRRGEAYAPAMVLSTEEYDAVVTSCDKGE